VEIFGGEGMKKKVCNGAWRKNLRKMLKSTPIEALRAPERDAPATTPVHPAL
jgi:hypothetical protein